MKFMVQLKIDAIIECSIHAENLNDALEIAQSKKSDLWDWGKKVDHYVDGEEKVIGVYGLD